MSGFAEVNGPDQAPDKIYPLTVIFPLLSFLSTLACAPPFIWHIRNRNTAAAALTFWLLILSLFSFLNGLVWPTDNIAKWPSGVGYCDVEIRINLAATGGIPAAMLCIIRDLARALDTNQPRGLPDAQKKTKLLWDLGLCVGVPLYFNVVYYIVQPGRYYLLAIQGCWPPIDISWPSIVLIMMWPLVLSVASALYALRIVIRIYQHGRDISRILSLSANTRSKFIRLLTVVLIVLFCFVPLQIMTVVIMGRSLQPYSWTATHSTWNEIVKIPTAGHIDQSLSWSWIACGFAVFAFFGVSEDAKEMYKEWMRIAGVGKCFPCLVDPATIDPTNADETTWCASKAKRVLKKMGVDSSGWGTSLSGKHLISTPQASIIRESGFYSVDVGSQEMEDIRTHRMSRFSMWAWLLARASMHTFKSDVTEKDLEAGMNGAA
jgi:pheromone a factor receptor